VRAAKKSKSLLFVYLSQNLYYDYVTTGGGVPIAEKCYTLSLANALFMVSVFLYIKCSHVQRGTETKTP